MPLNFDLAGKTYPTVTATVTPEQIDAYARAAHDANPHYAVGPDQVAPPVFSVVPGLEVAATVGGDPDLGVENPLMILHGEQEFHYHNPLRPGRLVLSPTLTAVEDKGSGATYVVRIEATTGVGEPVVDQLWTIFVRGAGSGAAKPSARATAAPVPSAVAASFTRKIESDMPTHYAAASGDHNPIHLDDAVARAVGLPGVINHGLGTLAVVAGGLVDHLADADPGLLRTLQARFTAPVFPGEEITTTVHSADRPGLYVYEVARPDGTRAVSGRLEVG